MPFPGRKPRREALTIVGVLADRGPDSQCRGPRRLRRDEAHAWMTRWIEEPTTRPTSSPPTPSTGTASAPRRSTPKSAPHWTPSLAPAKTPRCAPSTRSCTGGSARSDHERSTSRSPARSARRSSTGSAARRAHRARCCHALPAVHPCALRATTARSPPTEAGSTDRGADSSPSHPSCDVSLPRSTSTSAPARSTDRSRCCPGSSHGRMS